MAKGGGDDNTNVAVLKQHHFAQITVTQVDPDSAIIQLIKAALPADKTAAQIISILQEKSASKQDALLAKDYEYKEGLLHRYGLIYVPDDAEVKRKVLESRHDSFLAGHPGQMKTTELVTRDF